MKVKNLFTFLAILAIYFISTGCKDDAITSYRVPKSQETTSTLPVITQMGTTSSSSSREIQWKRPKEWREEAPSDMRLASFSATGKDGLKADISIVVLPGDAGGDLANINRWRGQINLDPISEADLPKQSKTISPNGKRMRMVDFITKDLLIDNRFKKRLIAVIYPRNGKTWFFKMAGEDALVRSQEASFMAFLKSLQFNDG